MSPDDLWYGSGLSARLASGLLAPLGWLYCAIAMLRALAYRRGWLGSESAGVPVIVVGNLTVGGTGKTPLVIWLVDHLVNQGYRPGVVMRGYGADRQAEPCPVPADADPILFGDEPALIAARRICPVVIGRDRVAGARMLSADYDCDLVVADDGLQHYRLRRDCEILVIDSQRRIGNGRCLPAGPLREPRARGERADLRIVNGGGKADAARMQLLPGDAVSLYDAGLRKPLTDFVGAPVTAVAGIGNPMRFFGMLRGLGLTLDARPYPDHHRYSRADIMKWPPGAVLMTEKDAVKCRTAAGPDHWYVPVQAEPDAGFICALDGLLDRLSEPGGDSGGQRPEHADQRKSN